MKILLIVILLMNFSCTEEQVRLSGELLGASLALALLANYSHEDGGQYYYRINQRDCFDYYSFYNNDLEPISVVACRYYSQWDGVYVVTDRRYNLVRVYQPRNF